MQREGNADMHACIRAHTHTHTQSVSTDLGGIFTSPKAPASVQICPFGGKKGNSLKLKCFRDVREKPVFSPEMPTKSTVVKMQGGLPACHCCQEKFLTSLKSQLLGNKNKFIYFQIEGCPVFAGSYCDTGWFSLQFRFMFSYSVCLLIRFFVLFMFASVVCFER